jgi:hypothetical protein
MKKRTRFLLSILAGFIFFEMIIVLSTAFVYPETISKYDAKYDISRNKV